MYVTETSVSNDPMILYGVTETFVSNDPLILYGALQNMIDQYKRKGINVKVIEIRGTMSLKLKVPGIEETRETSSPAQA